MLDPRARQAIEDAIARDPDNCPLRLHLAEQLLEDDPTRALQHATTALSYGEVSADALDLASRAADLAGLPDRAEELRERRDIVREVIDAERRVVQSTLRHPSVAAAEQAAASAPRPGLRLVPAVDLDEAR